MKTYVAKNEEMKPEYFIIDAKGKTLGRLASRIAVIITGKHKAIYTPFIDTGDFVVVINASEIVVTGKKADQKKYYRYSGYPGGMKVITYKEMLVKKPEKIIELAVKGMVPQNKLGRSMLKKLKVYPGNTHPHIAQAPKALPKALEI